MNLEDCAERIRLLDEYSRAVTEFNGRLEILKFAESEWRDDCCHAAESARLRSEDAWRSIASHLQEHQCGEAAVSSLLGRGALAALDLILVSNDERRYVEVNDAALNVFGMTRHEIVGRRVDEFFVEAAGDSIPFAWQSFVEDGVQSGICVLRAPGPRRTFEYQARAHFVPGFHVSILREVKE